MKTKEKTIVILSAKRCGSTALYKTLVEHKDVRNCQVGGKSRNWEPAFWYHGWLTLQALQPEHMRNQFSRNYSYMYIPSIHHKEDLFDMWDKVLKKRGPIVLDKSPQYLAKKPALDLLLEYKKMGHDVRIIGLIRDPRDAITSQYVKWHVAQEKKTGMIDSPQRREQKWLEKYKNLDYVISKCPHEVLTVKYENFVHSPYRVAKQICDYCDIPYQAGMVDHIVPTHIGRFRTSNNRKIKKWRGNYSKEFKRHLEKYGYI